MSKENQDKLDQIIEENTDLKDKVGKLEAKTTISESKAIVDGQLDKFIADNKLDEAVVKDLRTSLVGKDEEAITEAVKDRAEMLKSAGVLKNVVNMGTPKPGDKQESTISDEDAAGAVI